MLLWVWTTTFTILDRKIIIITNYNAKESKHVLMKIHLFCCNMQIPNVRKTEGKGNKYYLTNRRHLVNPLQGSW